MRGVLESADAGQLLACEHICHAPASDGGFNHKAAGVIGDNLSDNTGICPEGILLYGRKGRVCIGFVYYGNKLAFVCNVKGVYAQQLTESGHLFFHRQGCFGNADSQTGLHGNFI
jgi:hypothetical protein